MQSLQASKVTVTGVCFTFILWNPICELLLLLLTTGFPGQTTQTSLAPNPFLSSFLQCRANVIPADSDLQRTNCPALEANTGLTKAHKRWAKPPCPLPKGLLLRPGKGVNDIPVGQQTALPGTKDRTILQPELLKSNLDGGRQCCWSAARALMSKGHQAAGDSQAAGRASHTSGAMTWIEVTPSLLQT